jgi:hypothetical protein
MLEASPAGTCAWLAVAVQQHVRMTHDGPCRGVFLGLVLQVLLQVLLQVCLL